MNFTKMQGAGNDFILVESTKQNGEWSDTARTACDRHYGIGADGLLVLMPSQNARFKMRIFNADGSESGICGNGLRCMVRHYIERNPDVIGEELTVETLAGIRKVFIDKSLNGIHIKTCMGKPNFDESDIPVKSGKSVVDINKLRISKVKTIGNELTLNLVSMGNPHAVCFVDSPVGEYPLSDTGPEIATNNIFPCGANFEVARVIDRNRIEARVWERGVGETLACGSGACAITVAAWLRGMIDNRTDILLPGGVLTVEWDGTGEVLLSGPAEIVFEGNLPGLGE